MSNNPYDWPFPKRTDLMAFQTIKNSKQQLFQDKQRDNSLNVRDIDGTHPEIKPYRYINKEIFNNRIDDIQGTQSKQLIKSHNRQDNQLYLDDIKGTKPKINKFDTTRSPTNPLEPIYVIPSFHRTDPPEPKFVRDSFQIKDIEGAQPHTQGYKLKSNPIEYEDIKGSHPKERFLPKDFQDTLQVKDINEYMMYKTKRIINPLEPVYDHIDENGEKIKIGFVEGSLTRQLHPIQTTKIAPTTLITSDIKGAQAETHSDYFLRRNQRKDYRTTNNLEDIQGVKAGSLKKGIVSKRYDNPLTPNYQMPGHSEINLKTTVFQKTASTQLLSNAQKMDKFLKSQ